MNMTRCPCGGDCGGSGWEWVPAIDHGEPQPGDYVPCACNPAGRGQPEMLLDYDAMAELDRWIAREVLPEPF